MDTMNLDNVEADIKSDIGQCRGCAADVEPGSQWCPHCYWGKP